MTAGRSISGVEWVWLAADRIAPPFCNQLVVEGDGAGVGYDELVDAVSAAAEVQPGSRVRRRGQLWVADGGAPRVRAVDGAGWDGRGPDGAPFLRVPLPPAHATCEVLSVTGGDVPRLVFRTHHAAMDGQGTLLFADAVCAALRGEAPRPAEAGPTTDASLAASAGRSAEPAVPIDCPPPVRGVSGGASRGVTWRRRRVAGRFRRMLPRLAVAVAAAAGEPCRVDVPVDLRPLRPDLRSSANLTGLVRLPVAPADDIVAVTTRLRGLLDARAGADFVLAASALRRLPLAVIAAGGKAKAARQLTLGRYGTTATLSNLGRLDLDRFAAPGFTPRASFFIPPGSPGLPLFVACNGDAAGVEICATMPAALASHGRLEGLLDRFEAALTDGADA